MYIIAWNINSCHLSIISVLKLIILIKIIKDLVIHGLSNFSHLGLCLLYMCVSVCVCVCVYAHARVCRCEETIICGGSPWRPWQLSRGLTLRRSPHFRGLKSSAPRGRAVSFKNAARRLESVWGGWEQCPVEGAAAGPQPSKCTQKPGRPGGRQADALKGSSQRKDCERVTAVRNHSRSWGLGKWRLVHVAGVSTVWGGTLATSVTSGNVHTLWPRVSSSRNYPKRYRESTRTVGGKCL